MSRTYVALSLFLAASASFAAAARAQYNGPNNQYDLQRGKGGFGLPAPQNIVTQPQDTPRPEDIPRSQDLPKSLDRPYRIDQGCPSCR